jgi:hypothetical protein
MGTGIMTGIGEEKVQGKAWEFRSSYDIGKYQMTTREEWTVVSADEYTLKMYEMKGAKERLGMELVAKRKK